MLQKLYRNLVAIIKLSLILILVLATFVVAPVTYFIHSGCHKSLLKIFCKLICVIINVKVKGETSNLREGIFYISNHCSYLDIFVIGSKISVRFTPKSEIRDWPIFGPLVSLSLPVYIKRRGSEALKQRDSIGKVLTSGDNIIIFPEGTTNNGREIKKFKSSLFSVVENTNFKTHPLALNYTNVEVFGKKNKNMDAVAWYGDMTLIPHLWEMLKLKSINAEVKFLDPINPKDFKNRKEIAKFCEEKIRKNVKHLQLD